MRYVLTVLAVYIGLVVAVLGVIKYDRWRHGPL